MVDFEPSAPPDPVCAGRGPEIPGPGATRPERVLVVVADSGYAASALRARCGRLGSPIASITRLRLDAALYAPAPPRQPGQRGRPRLKGQRLPTLAACRTDPNTVWTPVTVANW